MNRLAPALALLLAMPALAADPAGFTVTGGKADEQAVVCTAPAGAPGYLKLPDGTVIPTQAITPSLLRPEGRVPTVAFVLPKLKAGETLTLAPAAAPTSGTPTAFKFVEKKGEYTDLLSGDRLVLRYFNAPHDPKDHYYTFKPFHQVFDPATGKTPLTTGAYKTDKEGVYPHHRGLFYGWNKISYDGKTADIWHGTKGVFSQHEKVLAEEAGPVLGRQRSQITWHGQDGQTFATEERELTAYAAPGGTLIDFASVLTTDRKSVKLDGDPQHAGFHFRANMDVATKIKAEEDAAKKEKRKATPSETYYLRPDGKGKPDETRNWDAKSKDPKTVNLPWDACSFVVGGKRYTALRINHPDNPGEARGSERNYARFGDYFEYELTPEKPLRVKYRVWVQEGEMTVEQCAAMREAFVHPPEVRVTK
jgi:hypothetical protein